MYRNHQFTLTTMLGLTALVALVVQEGSYWNTVAAIEVIAVFVCVQALVGQMPKAIALKIQDNSRRIDGTISGKRLLVERKAVRNLRWNLTLVFVLILLPANFAILLSNSYKSRLLKAEVFESGESNVLPIVVTVLAIWFLVAFAIVNKSFLYLLKKLDREIDERTEQYWRQDFLEEQDEARQRSAEH